MTHVPASVIVQFDRRRDRVNLCCTKSRFGKIGPGTNPHTANLICANCGAARGRLPRSAITLITDIVRKFGALDEPIVLRGEGEHG